MTSWYHAVCDKCREVCDIFVVYNRSVEIAWPLSEGTLARDAADAFLTDHWTCELRLLRDDSGSWPKDYKDRSPQ